MESIHKKLIAIIILGSVQLLILNALFWTGGNAIVALGSHITVLGNKNITITPMPGMIYVDHPDSLKRYETEGLVFVLKGDSLHPDKPTVWAEVYTMGELNSLEKMSLFLDKEAEQEIVFNRIQGSSLNVILMEGVSIEDSAFVYCRYLAAYPYFLRLRCSYNGTMWPSEEILDALKAVSLQKR